MCGEKSTTQTFPATRAYVRFHLNEFVYQIVILFRIPSFSCNINTNEFLLQTLRLLFFGTTVSRMHVREYDLLYGIAFSQFTYSCLFLL